MKGPDIDRIARRAAGRGKAKIRNTGDELNDVINIYKALRPWKNPGLQAG